jgi:peptide subunit release factor RF-3
LKAGIPRTKEKILAELEKQVKLACSGVLKPIKDSQTQTGVKDMYTQHWIDHLLARFKEMKTNEPDRSNQDIQTELIQWTVDNRDKLYSAFLTTDGTFLLSIFVFLIR